MKPTDEEADEFIKESNAIESEFTDEAFRDAKQAWIMANLCANELNPETGIDYILAIHRRLMKRFPRIAGKIRDVPVMIGGQVRDQSKKEIENELDILLHVWNGRGFLNYAVAEENKQEATEKFIQDWHVRFEKVHPFIDGNGRTGRILMNVQRLMMGLPLLIIHTGPEQYSYYKWFKEKK